jgi:hypothetical protein
MKDFAFMANSADWNQEQYYNLRSRSVLKSSYRKEGEDKYGPDLCQNCETNGSHWITRLTKAVLILAAAAVLYYVIIKKTPYCEMTEHKDDSSHCDYETGGIELFQSCKPCPKNAFCHGTTMVSCAF